MSKSKTKQTSEQQAFDKLRVRYDALSHERTRIDAQREAAQKQLDEMRESARTQFGTDDLEELEKKLADMRKQNEEKRAKYEASLDEIETKLKEVEGQFDSDETNTGQEKS